MSLFNKVSVALLLVCTSYSVHAEVFKCEGNGEITYSDKPCNGNAVDINQKHHPSSQGKASTGSTPHSEKTRKIVDEMEASRKKRALEREMTSLESKLDEKKKLRDSELLVLENRKNSIVEDDDDEYTRLELINISDEMTALNKKYSSEIDALTEQINNLRQRLSKMQ